MAVFHLTLFIAAIALLAPFIPAEIEVPAYIACLKNGCVNHKLVSLVYNQNRNPKR